MKKKLDAILLVANWESNVGYAWWLMENFWITIASFAEKQNFNSVLMYPKITEIPASIASTKINVIEHQVSNSLRNLYKLRKIIKQHNIRFIYLTDYPSYSLLYLALRFFRVKKIIIHDHKPGQRTTAKGVVRLLKSVIHRLPYINADHYIAVTEFVRDRLINTACIPAKKCSCAANGIIPIDLSGTDLEYAYNNFDIPKNRFIVVTTGRASYYKGIDFFIKCANEIVNTRHNNSFHFLYCGDGPDIDDFRTMVKQYSLESYFTFAGRRNDIRNILPSCHIGFHASLGEVGYSLSILEYMSAALLTIVPDDPSVSMATRHNDTGLIYEKNNLSDAVSLIIDYTKEKQKYTKIGKNASLYVQSEMSLDNTNKALIRIIDNILFANKSLI